MKDSQSSNFTMAEYWEQSYKSGDMAWDLGGPTPIFDDWIESQTDSLSVCILGAGNGWDAINFADKGHNVTAVDFAKSAIHNMHKSACERGLKLNLINSDIFDLNNLFSHSFDIVLEYTCYCAISPHRRLEYVKMVNKILKPNGKLVAILFPVDKDVNDHGPPFGVDLNSTITLFSKYFTLDTKEIHELSIDQRRGREVFIIFNKDGN